MRSFFTDSTGISRLMAFSDGVFSIAVTLLVFQLQLPTTENLVLKDALWSLWPKLLCYFVTFHMLGIYWIGHVSMCRHLKRYDRTFLVLNSIFLMFIALMPFPTAVLGSFPNEKLSVLLYAACFSCTGITLVFVWRWATKDYHLIDNSVSQEVISFGYKRILSVPAISVISVLLSFYSCKLSIALYILCGITYLFPSKIDNVAGDHMKQSDR